MKKIKFFLALIIISALILPLGFARPNDNENVTTKSLISLNNQLYSEISEVLKQPVYLAYENKNLKGNACVTMKVNKNGKLEVANVNGENYELNKYIYKKISSKNLWTPQKYANQYFRFKIRMA
jgi:hypothetical protein